MKHFKKIISLLMTAAMLIGVVSAFSTTAFAGGAAPSKMGADNYYVDKSTGSTVDVAAATVANYYVTKAEFTCNGVTKVTFDGIVGPGNYPQSTTFNVSSWAVGDYTLTYHVCSKNAGYIGGQYWEVTDDDYAYATIHVSCSHQKKTATGTVSPTCTAQGYTLYSCPSCGKTGIKDNYTTASHDYAWRTVAPATLSSAGLKEKYCTICKETFGTEVIPKATYTFEKSAGSTVMIDNIRGLLYGIAENTSSLEGYFTLSDNCSLQYSKPVGTGTNVRVLVGNELLKELTAIIYGDTTGDGIVDSFDVASLASVVNFESTYDTIALNEAADVYDDGYLDNIDLTFIIAAANCDITLDQRGEVQPEEPQHDYQYSFMDYQYGPHGVRNLMDFSMPNGITGEVGLVFYIHGGSWIAGNKDGYRGAIANMNSRGYAAAAINYRYASATSGFDEMAVDINNALSAIKSLAAENGVSINKVMLVGDSAGAHISLLYSYTKKSTAPITPVCVRGNASPADLTISRYKSSEPTLMEISCMAGTPTKVYKLITPNNVNDDWAQYYLREYSPSYHAGSGIPTLLCHGAKDDGVPMEGATNLYVALQLNNIFVDYVIYPNSGHELGYDPDCAAQADEKMYDMMETYLPAPNMPK